jgi:hypothetical protein
MRRPPAACRRRRRRRRRRRFVLMTAERLLNRISQRFERLQLRCIFMLNVSSNAVAPEALDLNRVKV